MKHENMSIDELVRELNARHSEADALPSKDLKRLHALHNAKINSIKRERDKINLRIADTTYLERLDKKINNSEQILQDLTVGINRSIAFAKMIDETSLILHGQIYNQRKQGIPKLTVGLFDHRGNQLEEFDYVTTSKSGYFEFNYEYLAPDETDTKTPGDNNNEKIEQGDGIKVYLRIFNAEGKLLHAEKRLMILMPRHTLYHEIVLDESIAPRGQGHRIKT